MNRSTNGGLDYQSLVGPTASDPDADIPGRQTAQLRLQRVLAAAGLGSRRACEALIASGRVTVNGRQVTAQGIRVDPARADVRVDGVRVAPVRTSIYLALNKPAGVVSTMADPAGRPCLGDYVGERSSRLFHVGRLDTETEGLILLTNDGELAHRLTHPSFGVPKTYLAEVDAPLPSGLGRLLRQGLQLEDGLARVDRFRVVERGSRRALIELVVHEGRNRLVRRLLEAAGSPVRRLVRTSIGSVKLGGLRPGHLRKLTLVEVAGLQPPDVEPMA
jgi:23S rRNA pseudouridine2605 synthase